MQPQDQEPAKESLVDSGPVKEGEEAVAILRKETKTRRQALRTPLLSASSSDDVMGEVKDLSPVNPKKTHSTLKKSIEIDTNLRRDVEQAAAVSREPGSGAGAGGASQELGEPNSAGRAAIVPRESTSAGGPRSGAQAVRRATLDRRRSTQTSRNRTGTLSRTEAGGEQGRGGTLNTVSNNPNLLAPPDSPDDAIVSPPINAVRRLSAKMTEAVKMGDVEDVKRLIKSAGAELDFSHLDPMGAAMTGNWPVLKWFIQEKNYDPNTKSKDGLPLLMLAARDAQLDMVKFLIEECQVDPDEGDMYGQTAVSAAADAGHWEVVRWLVESGGADKDAEVMLDDTTETTILVAARAGAWDIVKWLASIGADVEMESGDKMKVLLLAALADAWDIVRFLIEDPRVKADINARTAEGTTACYIAAETEQWEMVKWLCEHNARIELRRRDGLPLVCLAAYKKQWDIVDWLVRVKKAHINFTDEKLTPLYLATVDKQWELVKFLITKASRNLKLSGAHASLKKVARDGNLDMVRAMVNTVSKGKRLGLMDFLKTNTTKPSMRGAVEGLGFGGGPGAGDKRHMPHAALPPPGSSLNLLAGVADDDDDDEDEQERPFGTTCLLDAAQGEAWNVVEYILIQCVGADPSDADRQDINEMMGIAAAAGNLVKVKWLMRKGADYSYRKHEAGATVIARAAYANHWDVVKFLLTEGNADQLKSVGDFDEPLVHIAAHGGNWEMVKFLLLFVSADVETRETSLQRTVLAVAVAQGHLEIVKWLVSLGADVNATDSKRETPIVIAADSDYWDIVRWLICESGVDVDKEARNAQGLTIMAIACQRGLVGIVEFLFDHRCAVENIDQNDRSAIEVAAVAPDGGQLAVVQWLVTEGECEIPKDFLVTLAEEQHWTILRWVMEVPTELDVDYVKKGFTAIHTAARHRAWAEVEYLYKVCGADAQIAKALSLLFDQGPPKVMMRIFVHMLMLTNNPKSDDIVIRKFKRVLPLFDPIYVAELCRDVVDQSPSPIPACLSMSRMFSRLASENLVFYSDYMKLANEFSQTATGILDSLPSDRLAAWVLEEPHADGVDPGEPAEGGGYHAGYRTGTHTALSQALEFHDLAFIGSARLNRIVEQWWGNDKKLKRKFLKKPSALMRVPFFKLLLDHLSFVGFLTLFSYVMYKQVPVDKEILTVEYLLIGYGIAYFIRESFILSEEGITSYFNESWNRLDMGLCFCLCVAMICRAPHLGDKSNATWWPVVYTWFMIFTDFLFWTRSLNIISSIAELGPLLISLYKMIPEVLSFSLLWIMVQTAFFFAFNFVAESVWSNAFVGITSLLLDSYAGQPQEDAVNHFDPTMWQWPLLRALLVLFFLISSIIFVNLLIALMSYTFVDVKDKADKEYVFLSVSVRWKFDQSENHLPPPFNVVVTVLFLLGSVLCFPWIRRKETTYCSHCHYNSKPGRVVPKDAELIIQSWPELDRKELLKNPDKFCMKCFRIQSPLTRSQYMHERLSSVAFIALLWLPARLIWLIVAEIPMTIYGLVDVFKRWRTKRAEQKAHSLSTSRTKRTMRKLDDGPHDHDLEEVEVDLDAEGADHIEDDNVMLEGRKRKTVTVPGGHQWKNYQSKGSFFVREVTTITMLANQFDTHTEEYNNALASVSKELEQVRTSLRSVARIVHKNWSRKEARRGAISQGTVPAEEEKNAEDSEEERAVTVAPALAARAPQRTGTLRRGDSGLIEAGAAQQSSGGSVAVASPGPTGRPSHQIRQSLMGLRNVPQPVQPQNGARGSAFKKLDRDRSSRKILDT